MHKKTIMRAIGLTVAATLTVGITACSSGGDESTTFKIWHYEDPTSAMGIAWNQAIEVFEEEHPDVTVEFQSKAFDQIQQSAGMILNSDAVPDVMEYNKGNATAGLLASQGLLTDLSDAAEERGWDDMLPTSIQTTAKYDEQGVMGSGGWYGVPTYGAFATMFYNKDMFADLGLSVPTTLDELEDVMDAFVADGTTPLATGGADYPAGQLFYELALQKADRQFVNDYQLYENPVDFHGEELQFGADTFDEWVKKGYISGDAASLSAEDMGTAWEAGTYPMMFTVSAWYGRVTNEVTDFDWGIFNFPGNSLSAGSSGNLWVIPTNAANKDLAEDFIDITLRPEQQELMGNSGGLPVIEGVEISDERSKELNDAFAEYLESDGLAFYPDWPVPGYFEDLVAAFQSLINQSKSPDAVLDELAASYEDGVATVTGN